MIKPLDMGRNVVPGVNIPAAFAGLSVCLVLRRREKAKPVARRGRKATGLIPSRQPGYPGMITVLLIDTAVL